VTELGFSKCLHEIFAAHYKQNVSIFTLINGLSSGKHPGGGRHFITRQGLSPGRRAAWWTKAISRSKDKDPSVSLLGKKVCHRVGKR